MRKIFCADNYLFSNKTKLINDYLLFLLLTLIIICTYGCVSSSFGNKRVADKSLTSQIKKGVSHKEDIKMLIGSPQYVSFIGNDEQWSYYYHKSKMRFTTCIPIIGAIFGGADTEMNNLVIIFDKHGIVKKIGSGSGTGGVGGIQDSFK